MNECSHPVSRWRARAALVLSVVAALAATPQAKAQPAWQLDRGAQRIVLIGTLHVGQPSDRLEPHVLAALRDADQLFIEINDPPREPVQRTVAPIDQDALEAAMRECSGWLPAPPYELGQVGILSVMVHCEELFFAHVGHFAEYGTEELLANAFATMGKPHALGLESRQEMLSSIQSVPLAAMLKEARDNMPNAQSIERDLRDIRAFRNAPDDIALQQQLLAPFEGPAANAPWVKALIEDRNTRFFDRITAAAPQRGQVVMAVGLAHLFGPTGLLKRFEASGYRATRLSSDSAAAP